MSDLVPAFSVGYATDYYVSGDGGYLANDYLATSLSESFKKELIAEFEEVEIGFLDSNILANFYQRKEEKKEDRVSTRDAGRACLECLIMHRLEQMRLDPEILPFGISFARLRDTLGAALDGCEVNCAFINNGGTGQLAINTAIEIKRLINERSKKV